MNWTPRIRRAALILLAGLTIPGACSSQPDRDVEGAREVDAPIPAELLEDERNTIELFRRASESVVFINTKERQQDLFTRNILEIPRGSGSGFVWDRDGHIVTNFHVVQPGRTTPIYSVTLADGTTYDAEPVGWEPEQDLAVLKIDAPRGALHALDVGDSDRLVVGQKVLAIGNPFGLDQTLTTGIISALGREIQSVAGNKIRDVIQTDASINPGNSGGPLLDSSGRLIGVNTAIVSPSGSSAGIGFAVPVNTVKRIVPQLIEFGDVKRAGLGVRILTLDSYQRRRLGIGAGVVVQEVENGSAADKAGLRSGERDNRGRWHFDVIVAIDGNRIERYGDLYDALDNHQPGDRVKMRFVRERREYETEVVLQEIR